MLKSIRQYLQQKIWSGIFAINPKLLGDNQALAWTNLGLWQHPTQQYYQAAQRMAQQMATALQLKAQDQVLDIGCGYGASLKYWYESFGVNHIAALELQKKCCEQIKAQHLPYVQHLFCQSLFAKVPDIQYRHAYDVILSLDATYHYALFDYLQTIQVWLAQQGRIGFHYLVKSDDFEQLDAKQKVLIHQQLKWARVNLTTLYKTQSVIDILEQQQFEQIQIVDLTESVLAGFAAYFETRTFSRKEKYTLDYLKISMTAKLCASLAAHGKIRYVQITAQKY